MKALKPIEKRFAIIGGLLVLAAFLWFRAAMALGEGASFIRSAGLDLGGLLCRLWSVIPFPISELVWILGILSAILAAVCMTLRRRGWGFVGFLCRLLLAAGVMCMLFSSIYLVQYSAPSLADSLGMTVEKYTNDQLYSVALTVAEELNNYAKVVNRDSNGLFAPSSYKQLAERVLVSYQSGSMSRLYSKGPQKAPKQGVLLSRIMSYLNLSGYYFPLTGESIVSSDIIETSIPFTAAHEVAHAFGVGPEREANFAAFLCCLESGDAELVYSGLFNGYIYLNNALYRSDKELWRQLYGALSDAVRADLDAKSAHLRQFEGAVNDFGTSVNDTFIKATGQPDGVQSYGLVADMIIAYYLQS